MYWSSKSAFVAAVMVSSITAQTLSPPAEKTDAGYVVEDAGTFNTMFEVDFTTASALPEGFVPSTNPVGKGRAPYGRRFYESNIKFNAGDSVSLLVQPGVVNGEISSGEFRTSYKDILYGSVRTVAKASAVAGTCHGFFSYLNDTQETDIELLTTDLSKIWFTNQALTANTEAISETAPAPDDLTAAFHEYRIDWLKDRVRFYIDGQFTKELTKNVPNLASGWIWNNWANGDPGWSGGPPEELNDLRIKSITAYWNRTGRDGDASAGSSNTPSTIKARSTSAKSKSSTTTSTKTRRDLSTKIPVPVSVTTKIVKPRTTTTKKKGGKKTTITTTTTKKNKKAKRTSTTIATVKPAIRTPKPKE
ncbi:putative glycosyl hydrolases family 16 protein 9 [Elsinoe fawcettii]|nr:putative glycosyl hydrolases family 16 protein 9 [Elsinoe fawcettii]